MNKFLAVIQSSRHNPPA